MVTFFWRVSRCCFLGERVVECHAKVDRMVAVGEVDTVHGNSQLVLAVPVALMERGFCGFGHAQFQAPTQEVIMEQHHALLRALSTSVQLSFTFNRARSSV